MYPLPLSPPPPPFPRGGRGALGPWQGWSLEPSLTWSHAVADGRGALGLAFAPRALTLAAWRLPQRLWKECMPRSLPHRGFCPHSSFLPRSIQDCMRELRQLGVWQATPDHTLAQSPTRMSALVDRPEVPPTRKGLELWQWSARSLRTQESRTIHRGHSRLLPTNLCSIVQGRRTTRYKVIRAACAASTAASTVGVTATSNTSRRRRASHLTAFRSTCDTSKGGPRRAHPCPSNSPTRWHAHSDSPTQDPAHIDSPTTWSAHK